MSKFDNLKYFKRTKARVIHICIDCNSVIEIGEYYYSETIKDKFLNSLHRKKLCAHCFGKKYQ
jgi:hypothetical protein